MVQYVGLLLPSCVNGNFQGLHSFRNLLCSLLEHEMIFLNCSQSVCLILLGGSGSIPLTASCQTAVSENAPPSLGSSALFQPLLISAYISAEHEVAAQHINSLVAG